MTPTNLRYSIEKKGSASFRSPSTVKALFRLSVPLSLLLVLLLLLAGACRREPVVEYPLPPRTDSIGAVTFYSEIPSDCSTVRGLKQENVRQVHSVRELRDHYGMTMHVWFQDGTSPELYGSLYYQNRQKNKYCLALPDGRFAVFSNKRVGHRPNMAHEICYPIKDCINNPGFLSAEPGR